jgi:hypothetical protein
MHRARFIAFTAATILTSALLFESLGQDSNTKTSTASTQSSIPGSANASNSVSDPPYGVPILLTPAGSKGGRSDLTLVVFKTDNPNLDKSDSKAPAIVFFLSKNVPADGSVWIDVLQGEHRFVRRSPSGVFLAGLHIVELSSENGFTLGGAQPVNFDISVESSAVHGGHLETNGSMEFATQSGDGSSLRFYDAVAADYNAVATSNPAAAAAAERLRRLLATCVDPADPSIKSLVTSGSEDLSKWTRP